MDTVKAKIGVVTTYNQACGLATYASYLVGALQETDAATISIFAEDVPAQDLLEPDTNNVFRCWNRGDDNLERLATHAEEQGVEILHFNCHYRFFSPTAVQAIFPQLQACGIRIVVHLHSLFTRDDALQALVQYADSIIVHSPENTLEAIANGAAPERIAVLEHGVLDNLVDDRSSARRALSLREEEQVVVCFGFAQAHKGYDEVVRSVVELRAELPNICLHIVGGAHAEDSNSVQYLAALKQLVNDLGASSFVHFHDAFVSEDKVTQFLQAADAVVMNYRSNYYEASGALARALGCGAPVITSLAPTFARFGDTVFHATGGYPLTHSIGIVLTNEAVRQTLQDNARAWTEAYSWAETARHLSAFYNSVLSLPPKQTAQQESRAIVSSPSMKILMQNRSNAFSHRGGDTVVMERVAQGLEKLGVSVTFDLEGTEDVRAYDLVHIHNFATPEITEAFARRAYEAGVPYVVTTMYEDLPLFYNQMFAQFDVLQAYVNAGQPQEKWAELSQMAQQAEPSARWENEWTAHHAASLIATGERERQSLLRDYPEARRVDIYSCGCNLSRVEADGSAFIQEYGISDFVLCVGRLETRKNQLSLLKALEDSDIPVVFATGGFTYQPEYEAVCRQFKRPGKTIFLDRLDDELLASAFAAARVHALPSWYELPGIVSMEAARHNTNIVVTDMGTPKDYFGSSAYYCSPQDTETIYNAVMAAFYTPPKPGLVESVEHRTWDYAAKQVFGVYQAVLSASPKLNRSSYELPEWKLEGENELIVRHLNEASDNATEASMSVTQIADKVRSVEPVAVAQAPDPIALCLEADAHAQSGNYEEALMMYERIIELDPRCGRAHRSAGVMHLQSGNIDEATAGFERAIKFDATDARAIAGLGTCYWERGDKERAFDMYQNACERSPSDTGVLLQLISAAYTLGRMNELETTLRRYLEQQSGDTQIRYCLAGCLFKQEKYEAAEHELAVVLADEPTNSDALELQEIIQKEYTSAPEVLSGAPLQAGAVQPQPLTQQFAHAIDERLRELQELKEKRDYGRIILEADEIVDDASARPDQRALAQILKAESLACLERFEEATALLDTLVHDRVHRGRARTALGVIFAAREDWITAEIHLKEALNAQTDNDKAQTGLGICAMKQGRFEEAWDYYQLALAVNCENQRAILGLVQIGYELKKAAEVQVALENYLDIHPADLAMLYSYAGCLYAQGKLPEARKELEKILIFEPQHHHAHELLDKISSDLEDSAASM